MGERAAAAAVTNEVLGLIFTLLHRLDALRYKQTLRCRVAARDAERGTAETDGCFHLSQRDAGETLHQPLWSSWYPTSPKGVCAFVCTGGIYLDIRITGGCYVPIWPQNLPPAVSQVVLSVYSTQL